MTTRRRLLLHTVLCVFACALAAAGASAQTQATLTQTLVVPSSLSTVEGSQNSDFPFDISAYGFLSQRYQQVYAASEFAGAGGPVWISGIAFRPDAQWCMPFSATIPNLQIDLSTTTPGPGALSLTFAANVGSEHKLVFDGQLPISITCAGPALGPKEFELKIPLTAPFLYDPSKGNLLMDVRTSVPVDQPMGDPFDAEWTAALPVSSVYTFSAAPGAVEFTDGSTSYTGNFGLITQFEYTVLTTPVPAPVALTVPVDIKPGACPNVWNAKSEGVLPVAILGTKDFDVTTLDPATILLAGVAPLRWNLADVGTPFEPFTGKEKVSDCSAKGPDGIRDLALKFDSSLLLAALKAKLENDPVDGQAFVFPLTAKLKESAGGNDVTGEDVVLILYKGKK